MKMGGCVGIGVAGAKVTSGVSVKVGGGGVAVGRAAWVRATPGCFMF